MRLTIIAVMLMTAILFIGSTALAANRFTPIHPWPTNLDDLFIVAIWSASIVMWFCATVLALSYPKNT